MTTIQVFILILVIHFLADFGLQTHDQATKKGESDKWLSYHVGVYTLIWSLVFLFLPVNPEVNNFYGWSVFVVYIFVTHFIVDWCTARIGKPFWKNNDYHNGFVVVGIDQVLHYLSLIFILLGTRLLILN